MYVQSVFEESVRAPQIDLVKGVAHDLAAMGDVSVRELAVELLDPGVEGLGRVGKLLEFAVFVAWHGDCWDSPK